MSSFKLLVESNFDNVECNIELCESTKQKRMYVEGITLQSEVKNRNGRIYPEEVLDEAIQNYINETQSIGMTMEGCLKHPKENAHEIDEKEISHRFVDLKKDGKHWYSKALILDTPNGKIVQNLIEGGVKLGVSSRCLGQLKNINGVNIVQKGLRVVTPGDLVRRPSAPDAIIDQIYENKEYLFQNGVLIEKDLSEDLDKYKKLIDKTSKKDRAEVFEKIILDYFNKIGF